MQRNARHCVTSGLTCNALRVNVSPMITTPNATVAATVRAEMARRNVTTRDLASKLEVSAAWVSRRTTGSVPITLDDAHRIAGALEVDPAVLLTT